MHRIPTLIAGAVLAAGLSWSVASAQTAAPAPTMSTTTTSTATATATTTRRKSEATQELINKVIEDSLARTRRAKETGTEERFER